MVYTCKPSKISIYINSKRKTPAQIQAETGCTALINGGLFNMSTFKPLCHLKADGKVYASDQWGYWGFGWDNDSPSPAMVSKYDDLDNYICCVALVRDGQAEELIYPADMGGTRPRTAFGMYEDGRVWLWCDTAVKMTPEALQDVALKNKLKHAIMLDGGGSTQGISPAGTVSSSRIVPNYICVWDETAKPKGDTNMFKIALSAGHGINTPGKRCLKSLDPNETREWFLNDRVCDYVEAYLRDYEGYELRRMDDSDDGAENVELADRVKAANSWPADLYLSIHHNAGVNGGSGGGIVAFSYTTAGKETVAWRDAFYDALIAHTGLKGDRYTPKTTGNFYVLKNTSMAAVLLELGFMDSRTDVPVILTNEYAQKCAKAIVEVLVARGGLKKKAVTTEPGKVYRVQVGAYSKKASAAAMAAELKGKGYPAYITE